MKKIVGTVSSTLENYGSNFKYSLKDKMNYTFIASYIERKKKEDKRYMFIHVLFQMK